MPMKKGSECLVMSIITSVRAIIATNDTQQGYMSMKED